MGSDWNGGDKPMPWWGWVIIFIIVMGPLVYALLQGGRS